MNFQWAIQQLKEGKKVRRKSWMNGDFIEDFILRNNRNDMEFKLNYLNTNSDFIPTRLVEAIDWEIYEEETLSDKIDTECGHVNLKMLHVIPYGNVRDKIKKVQNRLVKEFLVLENELRGTTDHERINEQVKRSCRNAQEIFKEEFGDKLI